MTTIKKLINNLNLDKEMLLLLLDKDSGERNDFSMTNKEILTLINKVELTNSDLIKIAKGYKLTMSPDQIIKLYEEISIKKEEYTLSYLYVLAEYEMIDSIRDILSNSQSYEYSAFKALIDLKDFGKNSYSIDTLCFK